MSQSDYLIHYGVMGMKWGIRKDGKPQGYQSGKRRSSKSSLSKTTGHSKVSKPGSNAQSGSSASSGSKSEKKFQLSDKQKKALAIGAAVAVTAAAAYGTYKVANISAASKIAKNTSDSVKATDMIDNLFSTAKAAKPIMDKARAEANKTREQQAAAKKVKQERRDFVKNITTKSDKEVSDFVNRLSQEKKARDLTAELVDPGKSFVTSTVKSAGRKVVPALATAAATSGLGYIANKKTSDNPKDKEEETARRKKVVRDTASDTRKLVTKK